MKRKWIGVLLLLALAVLLGRLAYQRLVVAGTMVNDGLPFYDVAQGTSVRFITRGSARFHILSYFVEGRHEFPDANEQPKTRYVLHVTFLSKSGTVLSRRIAYLSIEQNDTSPTLARGERLAKLRLLQVLGPKDATLLELSSPDARIFLHVNKFIERGASNEDVLARQGFQPSWFETDEKTGLLILRGTTLPALDALPAIRLPHSVIIESEANQDPLALMEVPPALSFGPHRALVFNVLGPGTLTAKSDSAEGRFSLQYLGVHGAGRSELKEGRASIKLPAGPSSVTVLPVEEDAGVISLSTERLRPLGPPDALLEPALRDVAAWRIEADRILRFPMYGSTSNPLPVRLTVRSADGQMVWPLRWRFLDGRGRELIAGVLTPRDEYDPYSGIRQDGFIREIGVASQSFLLPPSQAAVLELSGVRAIAQIDVLVEKGARPQPLPPFDIGLVPGLHWQDVAVRGPRWLMLRPLGTESETRQVYVALLRMPRIESFAVGSNKGPWVSLTPYDAARKAHVVEPMRNPSPKQEGYTFPLPEYETSIVVAAHGRNARRIVVTCELDDTLGGKLKLFVDGHKSVVRKITTSAIRLETRATSGIHRVRVEGAQHGRCAIPARAQSGALTVRRSIYQLSSQRGVSVKVRTRRDQPLRLYYAIYSSASDGPQSPEFVAMVDDGHPVRRLGSFHSFTASQTRQVLRFTATNLPSSGPRKDRLMRQVAISSFPIGDDLRAGRHRIRLRALSPGRYWARFWILGRRQKAEGAESFVTTDLVEQRETED